MEKTKSQKIGIDLTEGSILKALLLFAFPIVLTNLVQQLYSTVDLIIIGQFAGKMCIRDSRCIDHIIAACFIRSPGNYADLAYYRL